MATTMCAFDPNHSLESDEILRGNNCWPHDITYEWPHGASNKCTLSSPAQAAHYVRGESGRERGEILETPGGEIAKALR
jgi:hypothetical protein